MAHEGLAWVRVTSAIGAFLPLHLRSVKNALLDAGVEGQRMSWRTVVWFLASVALSALCLTDWFVPAHSTSENKIYGAGYYGYIGGICVAYGWLFVTALRQVRVQSGLRKLELQILILGGCATALTVLVLMVLAAYFVEQAFVRFQPLVIIIFYTGTVVAITTHRIFDARQLIIFSAKKLSLIIIVTGVAYSIDSTLEFMQLPTIAALLVTVGLALWTAGFVSSRLDSIFEQYPEAMAARQAAFEASGSETRVENLERRFLSLLRGWGRADHATIVAAVDDIDVSGRPVPREQRRTLGVMRAMRWATPERLARERTNEDRRTVGDYMTDRQLGVLVFAEGPSLSVLVGVGVGASRRPYTYPQVTQLMELASIMESALERAHFSAKVQRTEQLATVGLVGASLAHEIRNPLVSIKTFVQLLPTHHQDPVFRERFFRLIGSEVDRIDQLTEQLLDLSAPRAYAAVQVALHEILLSSLDLVRAKAADKQVEFSSDFAARPDQVFTDPAAARQVMLNLCFNAIQAVEAHRGDRCWVRISTRNVEGGVEMAVADSGPGIAPEMRERLFQPFQTTKSTGFGLGLAICRDILANLQASISVDPPEAGKGATFRVTYPCQVSSS